MLARYEVEGTGYGNSQKSRKRATYCYDFCQNFRNLPNYTKTTMLRCIARPSASRAIPADAEDVLQTVFLRILNQGRPAGILCRCRKRTSGARRPMPQSICCAAESRTLKSSSKTPLRPIAKETETLLKERLRRAIATLEQNDALMFLLRHVEGLTNGELAEMFGQEKNSIAVRLHRIRQALQIEMER